MVDRFLAWRLPKPWTPDNGISYVRPNYMHAPADHDWPTGTNLFDWSQVEAMVRYMIEGMPGLAARPKVEDAEVEAVCKELRLDGAPLGDFRLGNSNCLKAADLLERLAGELDDVTADRDEWKQQHESLVGVRETDIANLAAKIDGLKTELDRRKGDPRTRLHNLCEALQEDLDKSPYTREEWEQVDREIVELQRKLRESEAKLAEREAELAKAVFRADVA